MVRQMDLGRAALGGMWDLACIAVLSSCVWRVGGSVHEYVHAKFTPQGNAYVLFGGSEGLYSSTSQANRSGIGNGLSYIRFDHSLSFRRPDILASKHDPAEQNSGLVEAIVFEVAEVDRLGGSAYGGQLALCCTEDLARDVGCTKGEVIYRPSAEDSNWPQSVKFHFKGNDVEARASVQQVKITRTGMYILYFIFCDPQLEGLEVDGTTVWKNPSGYLPGRMMPLVSFYGVMSLAYLILGAVWFYQYARFWRDILQLQNCITVVIALGMAEVALWYFDYLNFNSTGRRPVAITIWAVTIGAIKKTFSRLLILVVSMGYGVVRPTLGGLTSKVLLLGGIYFLASESLDVVEHVGRIDEVASRTRLLLLLPVAILDAIFILWIFTSLSKTLEKLQVKRSVAKLVLYRKFTNFVVVAVLIAVSWIGYELFYKASDPVGEYWQRAWIISSFWNILTFLLLCAICALWAPSQNSTRYAYSEEVGEDFDDEEAVALASNGMLKPMTEPEKASAKQEKKDRKSLNTDVFSLDDELEEDKRE
ncbi:hypothetical protein O6H91_Y008700 [Diphasiastrum complanatum]|nr:hypothetical protein O6H91_Y008700 [Diphasiastrum complanatum]KAJ7298236.1 hypothetical protein O6H91_Y008700 [Diphasiastrum complanatum]KAJ7298237.1 hypothetical protein O6H91_Y008700 [Diphasiastrum complanatum]KAJ7298238.1 hypothetical protein O6H91_Y008700 [Diphasiastrum complanatum]